MQAAFPHTGVAPDNAAPAPQGTDAVPMAVQPAAPNPPHATIESTLAPTSEFTRNFLLALPARYLFRGSFKSMFAPDAPGAIKRFTDRTTRYFFPKTAARDMTLARDHMNGSMLETSFGAGALWLTGSYAKMVYNDMFHLFREAVAFESGKDPSDVKFADIRGSDNRIIAKTVQNFYMKTMWRGAVDALFFARPLMPALKWTEWGEVVLGLKGVQFIAETWKREPTLFEHFTALVNSKINPKNGLGQPLTSGEVFDLYQHYHFQFTPEKAFRNVLDGNTNEARTWAGAKPIFDRITELLNLTYSYKHATSIDAVTNLPIRNADFALPKFIYLLGHDMIDPAKPAQTLLYIEIANTHGMEAVKHTANALKSGASINDVLTRFPVTIDITHQPKKDLAPTTSKKGTKPLAEEAPTPATIPPTVLAAPERSTSGTLISGSPALVH